MLYAQIKKGQKLHLVYEAGEGHNGEIVHSGNLSRPLCGRPMGREYRMNINLPLGNACKRCLRVHKARASR